MKKTLFTSLLFSVLPLIVSAAPATVDSVLTKFSVWVLRGTILLGSAALLVFFWGLVRYIAVAGDDKGKERGRRIMAGGSIALFFLFSVFGIIRFLQNSFDIRNNGSMKPPVVTFP
jgi:hypothetical protein